ncbi:hypothetical protein ACFS07_31345 [Undibacterium arcticum]
MLQHEAARLTEHKVPHAVRLGWQIQKTNLGDFFMKKSTIGAIFFKLSGMGLLSVAVTSTFGLTSAFATATTYTFPPEWAPQASVWLCWDSTDDLHRTTDAAMHAVTAQIVEALHSKKIPRST